MSSTGSRREEGSSPDTSLLGSEIDDQFQSYLERDYLSEEDLQYLMKFIPTHNQRGEIQRRMSACKREGFKEDGQDDPETDPGANVVFSAWVKGQLRDAYSEILYGDHVDPLTQAAMLASSRESSFIPYAMFDPIALCWMQPGCDGYITGVKRSGKTSLGCRLGEKAIEDGYKVIAAIPLEQPRDEYVYCPSGTQMLRAGCHFALEGIDSLFLLDEGAIAASGETPLKGTVMHFRQFSRLFGKMGMRMLFISQYTGDVPSEFRKNASFRARKIGGTAHPDRAHIQLVGQIDKKNFEWSGRVKWIPDATYLKYRTKDTAAFDMDFDPGNLQEYLAQLPMDADRYGETLHWLDERGLQFKPAQKRWFARRAHTCHVTNTKIAEILGVSQPTISRWIAQDESDSRLDDEMLGEQA